MSVIDFATNSKGTQNLVLTLGWLGVVILVVVLAFFLQMWYKNNYEKNLFKKGDELYNVMTFIYNSRNSGLSDSDIKKKLSTAGWRGEQINYAFDKLAGKVLGIFGIPIFRATQEKKVREEIERRQVKQADARFIKRPFV